MRLPLRVPALEYWNATEVVARFAKGRTGHVAIVEDAFDFWHINALGERMEAQTYTVPAGFLTDFASVPRFLWTYAAPWDVIEAAVAHDWLYRTGIVPRWPSDEIFYHLMRARVVDPIRPAKARMMYRGVRIGAGRAWRNHRKAHTP